MKYTRIDIDGTGKVNVTDDGHWIAAQAYTDEVAAHAQTMAELAEQVEDNARKCACEFASEDEYDEILKPVQVCGWHAQKLQELKQATQRIAVLETENARLNMEMECYRAQLTPKDAAAMRGRLALAVIDVLYFEKQRAALSSPEAVPQKGLESTDSGRAEHD